VDLRTLSNQVLGFVGSTSLTDVEFTFGDLNPSYTVELYGALLAVLDGREAVSGSRDRLRYFFLARGIEVGELTPPKSNIFYGSVL
jgi:hypothetical protein